MSLVAALLLAVAGTLSAGAKEADGSGVAAPGLALSGTAMGAAAGEAGPSENAPQAPRDTLSVTHHTAELDGRNLDYTATAERIALPAEHGEPEGRFFYVAYVADPDDSESGREAGAEEPQRPARPITFVFNGGPGAASAFLNLGALGPRRVVFPDDGTPPPPPARLAGNPQSWLAFTDLVFVDPIGTGFSRAAEDGDNPGAGFWGVREDLGALARFVRLYLTRNRRWVSPLFLVGESYGGFRGAALAEALQARHGIGVNGVVLVSPVLEFSLIDQDSFSVLPWVVRLPSYAAAAIHHGRADRVGQGQGPPADGDACTAAVPVEAFAAGDFVAGLVQGAGLDDAARERLEGEVAARIGLPAELVRRYRFRVPREVFMRELLSGSGRVVGAYDGSVVGLDPDPAAATFRGPDPTLEGLLASYNAAFNAYVRDELGFQTDLTYELLNREVGRHWDWRSGINGSQGFVGTADSLRGAFAVNPALRVMIAHGCFDLVTPYFASAYAVNQLWLDPAVRSHLALRVYGGGHMFYTHRDARERFSRDARAFYAEALSRP